jgi:hypothetical protein
MVAPRGWRWRFFGENERKEGKAMNREIRGIVYLALAIMLALVVCASSVVEYSVFSIIVSIVLVGVLCVGLGYEYSRNEDAIEAHFEGVERHKKESKKVDSMLKAYVGAKPKLEGEKEVGESGVGD